MFRASSRTFLVLALCCLAGACAYPRRSTALSAAPESESSGATAPENVWQVTFVSAQIPPRTRSGHEWDDDGAPDPLVRLYRGETLLWQSQSVQNALQPEFNASPPRNVHFPRDEELRIELWDQDVSRSIIGLWRGRGLPPNALPDADANIMLEGGASVTIRISRPQAHRGVGITTYEFRGSSLHVIALEQFSPAGRAGLQPGDEIVKIGEDEVGDLGEARAASAISLAADRQLPLEVERDGQRLTVELDRGLTWLVM